MTMTPLNEIEYKLGEPPTRAELPATADGWIDFRRGGPHGRQEAEIVVNGQPLEQRLVKHSPTGLEFGYGGSGPGDTALNILALFVSPKEANRLHQQFKWSHIATIPSDGGRLTFHTVLDWIRDRYAEETSDTERMAREAEMRKDNAEIARLDAQEAAENANV